MRTFLSTAFVLLGVSSASAQITTEPPATAPTAGGAFDAPGRGFGFGVQQMFNGPGGVSAVFDLGAFHLEGILGAQDRNDNLNLGLGARGWFHLHNTAASDFSVGGGLGFINIGGAPENQDQALTIEVGSQLRLFVVPNVALTGFVGISFATLDGDGWLLSGNLVESLGLVYFFQ